MSVLSGWASFSFFSSLAELFVVVFGPLLGQRLLVLISDDD